MVKIFYDYDGNKWEYDDVTDKTNCELFYDYHIVEGNKITLCHECGEVISSHTLEKLSADMYVIIGDDYSDFGYGLVDSIHLSKSTALDTYDKLINIVEETGGTRCYDRIMLFEIKDISMILFDDIDKTCMIKEFNRNNY